MREIAFSILRFASVRASLNPSDIGRLTMTQHGPRFTLLCGRNVRFARSNLRARRRG